MAYGMVVAAAGTSFFLLLPWPPGWIHALAGLGLLVPGRVQGVLWRDFFRGRRAMDQRRISDALASFSRFERALDERPWLRHAIYLQWSFYTWNARAMVSNNIGACELGLGNLDRAEARLEQALQLDPGSPLPYFNLAILAHARGLIDRSDLLRREAEVRGFRGCSRERVILMAGSALAAVEGRQ